MLNPMCSIRRRIRSPSTTATKFCLMCEQYPYIYCVFSVKRNSLWRRTIFWFDKFLSNTTSFLVCNLCWCGLSNNYLLNNYFKFITHKHFVALSLSIQEGNWSISHYHCQKQPISWTFLDIYMKTSRWSNVMESVDWICG